jgi:hypothetical protein
MELVYMDDFPNGTVLSTENEADFLQNPDPNKIGWVLQYEKERRHYLVQTAEGNNATWDLRSIQKQWSEYEFSKLEPFGLEFLFFCGIFTNWRDFRDKIRSIDVEIPPGNVPFVDQYLAVLKSLRSGVFSDNGFMRAVNIFNNGTDIPIWPSLGEQWNTVTPLAGRYGGKRQTDKATFNKLIRIFHDNLLPPYTCERKLPPRTLLWKRIRQVLPWQRRKSRRKSRKSRRKSRKSRRK